MLSETGVIVALTLSCARRAFAIVSDVVPPTTTNRFSSSAARPGEPLHSRIAR